ncbi:YqaE/Pmp3 family membrane protein [Pontibacter sp. SGAir0037]|uniref:YqaE/Pmp3 family membrane protein n=1 Tax=Pontibacter sp. SGAir0037 TaxID=2571030 RepID=UPI0026C8EA54
MKIKSILNLVVVMVLAQLMFSCNSAKYYDFGSHSTAYHQKKEKPAPAQEAEALNLSEVALAAADEEAAKKDTEPTLEATTAPAPVIVPNKAPKANVKAVAEEANAAEEVKTVSEAEAMAMAKERIASMTKAEKKELKKEVKEAMRQSRGGGANIVEIILAVILPPLAVFLHDGIGTSFWINIILTLLFWIPGIIHALLVVTDTI